MTLLLTPTQSKELIEVHGYQYEQDEDDLPSSLLCPICQRALLNPFRAATCSPSNGHDFCFSCITSWVAKCSSAGNDLPTCPLDRTPLGSLSPSPKEIQDQLKELLVICLFKCGWKGKRKDWSGHLEKDCAEVEVDGLRRGAGEVDRLKAQLVVAKSELERLKDKLRGRGGVSDSSNARGMGEGGAKPIERHIANCDSCHSIIQGVRYKCLLCPDYDLCGDCHPSRNLIHPTHKFAHIHSLGDMDHNPLPFPYDVQHLNITCDSCGRDNLRGPRYKCTACPNYDLCHACICDPHTVHDTAHPMIRYAHSVH